ncbi:MAG TPA: GntR family transcriptional regulator [Thermodesulfobacteriota bacterium]
MKPLAAEPPLPARVAAEMRAAILAGVLAPGTRIKQEALAAELGVSREPVRQALLLLEREGLVRATPRRGAVVAPLDRQAIRDLYELREAIEGLVAAKVAARRDFDPAPLRDIVGRGRAAARGGSLPRLIDLDLDFHMALYEASGNRVMTEVMRGQWSHVRRLMAMTLGGAGYRVQAWDEHAALVEAIAGRKPARARAIAVKHARAARRHLLAASKGEDS